VSGNFPPRSAHNSQIDVLLTFLQGFIPECNAVYVSSPITSGRRYIEWIKQHPENRNFSGDNQNPEFIASVIEKNREHAKSVVQKMRTLFFHQVVIDPTAVPDLSGWSQDDYRYAWGRIIEQYAALLVLSDDWQFSSGCIYEYLIGKRTGIKVLDEEQREITLERGLQLIREAINLMESHNLSITFHESICSELARRKTAEVQI
jgi:hypothetical protein